MSQYARKTLFWIDFTCLVGGAFIACAVEYPYAFGLGVALSGLGCLMLLQLLIRWLTTARLREKSNR